MVNTEEGRESGLLYGTKFKFFYPHVADPAKPSSDDGPLVAEIEADFAAEYTDIPENYTRREQERFGAQYCLRVAVLVRVFAQLAPQNVHAPGCKAAAVAAAGLPR